MSNPAENIPDLPPFPDTDDAALVLAWAADQFGPNIALVSSLGPQTLVAIDLLAKLGRMLPVVLIDTELLFPETYALKDRLEQHFGIRIQTVGSDLDLTAQANKYGDRLWEQDPDLCCGVRKVVPLRKALNGLDAWITGLRRDQSSTRSDVRTVEWDALHGLVKVNPLAAWTQEQTLRYLRENAIPYNPLLNRGYASVGCWTCTRRSDGGSERAGRWAGSKKSECGLHFSTGADGRLSLTRTSEKPSNHGDSQ